MADEPVLWQPIAEVFQVGAAINLGDQSISAINFIIRQNQSVTFSEPAVEFLFEFRMNAKPEHAIQVSNCR